MKKRPKLVSRHYRKAQRERESIAWAHRNIKFDCSCTYLNRSVKLSTEVDFGREQTRPLGLLARAQKYLPEAGRHRKRKAQGHTSKFRIPKVRPLKDAIRSHLKIQNSQGETFERCNTLHFTSILATMVL